MNILAAIGILLVTMIFGIPVPLAFFASSVVLIFLGGMDPVFLLPYGFSKVYSIILLTAPMFIMAGSLMESGGIGRKLIEVLEYLVGSVKGGLAIVTVIACGVFGAISGSSSATLSCIGSIMGPQLRKNGYPEGFIGAILASSGVLGILIPPSMIMILYAWVGNQSVLASFLATTIPGIILIVLFSIFSFFYVRKNPDVKFYTREDIKKRAQERKESRKKNKEHGALAAVMMPVFILGSIYGGFMTATEAAAFSVIYAVIVGKFIYRELDYKIIKASFVKATVMTGVITLMLVCIQMLAKLYIMENLPMKILNLMYMVSDNKYVILLMLNLFMVVLGMLMDDTSATLLATPILLPIAMKIGVSPIHFAAILGVNLGMGNITPPTAPLTYLASRITGDGIKEMLKPTILLILCCWLPVLMLVTFVPQLSLWLPGLLGY